MFDYKLIDPFTVSGMSIREVMVKENPKVSGAYELNYNNDMGKYSYSNNTVVISQIYNITTNKIDNKKINKLIQESHKIDHIKKFQDSYEVLFSLLRRKKYSTYSTVLNNINVKNATPMVLVGLLRLSYTSKNKIKGWNSFLYNVQNALKAKRLDDQGLLEGLV